MVFFVKELDSKTARMIRPLAKRQRGWQIRLKCWPRLFVVWVGGDKQRLAKWAAKHKLADVYLGVIPADDRTLTGWRINRKARHTTVVLDHSRARASFTDLKPSPDALDQLGRAVDTELETYKR